MFYAISGGPQMLDGNLIPTAALHPDWQLLLDALFTALAQPSDLPENLLSGGFLDILSSLTLQVEPNSAAQQTAAAIVCYLSVVQIEEAPTQQGKLQNIFTAVSADRMNGVMQAMMSGFRVR